MASQAAQTHIDSGADVLTGTAQMVAGAIGVAKDQGVLWFGTQSAQTSLAPDIVVASQVYHFEVVLKEIIDLVKAGTLGGQSFAITLANGGEVIEYNQKYTTLHGESLAEVAEAAGAAIQGIIDGTITVEIPQ